MITLVILFGSFAAFSIFSRMGILFKGKSTRELAVYAMAFFLVFFGLSHFYKQDELILILPNFIPYPNAVIFITGIIEILLAIGLLIPSTRKWAGILTAIYFLAVLPANINKAINGIDMNIAGTSSAGMMAWLRLLFQPIFIGWALYCSKPPLSRLANPENDTISQG